MKKKLAICFCLFCFSFSLFSQRTIKGRVVNEATGEPVPGSSVFISNTSAGTTADKAGYFELMHVPPGRHELIISSVGYETNVLSFTSDQLPLNLKVEMKVKIKELETVVLEPSVEEGWDKWGRLFMDNFMGNTPNASQCRIRNEKAIRFRFYKRSNRVIAYSDEPLVIENKALGYTIRYQLENFEVNFKDRSSAFAGYPLFEEMQTGRKGLQRRWKEAREKAYHGSMMHFMRSLYRDSLAGQGYEVRRMKRVPNLEKERVKAVYRAAMSFERDSISGRVVIGRKLPPDSAAYYESVLRQRDYTDVYGNAVLTADSLVMLTEKGYKAIYFTDYIHVTYKKELEDEAYILFYGQSRKPEYQRSSIKLASDMPIAVYANGGYYPPQQLFSMAYWGWNEKTANLLPANYEPGD